MVSAVLMIKLVFCNRLEYKDGEFFQLITNSKVYNKPSISFVISFGASVKILNTWTF